MAFKSDWANVQNVSIRPLTEGMITNLPSNSLPSGSFLDIKNLRVSESGLAKRGGIHPFHTNIFSDDATYIYENEYLDWNSKIADIIFFWKPDDDPEALIITSTQLGELGANNEVFIRTLTSTIDSGDITSYTNTGTTSVVLTSLTDNGYWRKGDYAEAASGPTAKGKVTEVRYNGGYLEVTVDWGITGTGASGDLTGYHQFKTDDKFGVDWTVTPSADNRVVLCDIADRGIYEYDGTNLTMMTIDNTDDETDPVLEGAKICTMFADRLWLANTIEDSGSSYVQRIRWSNASAFDTFADDEYVDLPYSDGEILKLVPMGSTLVVYCEDAVYFGTATNVTGLPYKFTRMETGGIGPVSQRAIQPWIDGHFFVGPDDVYWFNATTSLQPITDPILKESLTVCKDVNMLKFVEVAHDPIHEQLVFLFPDVSEDTFNFKGLSTKLWVLNTKSKGWSYYEVPKTDSDIPRFYFSTVTASRFFTVNKSWEYWIDLEDEDSLEIDWIDSDLTYYDQWFDKNSWLALSDTFYLDKTLFLGIWYRRYTEIEAPTQYTQGIYFESENSSDYLDSNREYDISIGLMSPDYDFGYPDMVKTVTRISTKCTEQPSDQLVFSFYVSDDRGLTWKTIPDLRWNTRYDEGKVDFRSSGSNFRFKMYSTQDVDPYTISELVIRVSGRGLQVDV